MGQTHPLGRASQATNERDRRKDEVIQALTFRNERMQEQVMLGGAVVVVAAVAAAIAGWRHVTKLEQRFTQLQAIARQLQNELQNSQQSFQTAIGRVQADQKYLAAGLARDALEVADNLERVVNAGADVQGQNGEAHKKDVSDVMKGVCLTSKGLQSVLQQHGVRKMELTPRHTPFDPHLHEAVSVVPLDEGLNVHAKLDGCVSEVFFAGYMLHDRVLRPAKVSVFQKPPSSPQPPPAAGGGVGDNATQQR